MRRKVFAAAVMVPLAAALLFAAPVALAKAIYPPPVPHPTPHVHPTPHPHPTPRNAPNTKKTSASVVGREQVVGLILIAMVLLAAGTMWLKTRDPVPVRVGRQKTRSKGVLPPPEVPYIDTTHFVPFHPHQRTKEAEEGDTPPKPARKRKRSS
jgi:hypothetical protein